MKEIFELIENTGMFKGTLETLYMVFFSTVLAYIFGLPMGVLVVVTDKKGIKPNRPLNLIFGPLSIFFARFPF